MKENPNLQVSEVVRELTLFYSGDTTIDLLEARSREILKYSYVIHECASWSRSLHFWADFLGARYAMLPRASRSPGGRLIAGVPFSASPRQTSTSTRGGEGTRTTRSYTASSARHPTRSGCSFTGPCDTRGRMSRTSSRRIMAACPGMSCSGFDSETARRVSAVSPCMYTVPCMCTFHVRKAQLLVKTRPVPRRARSDTEKANGTSGPENAYLREKVSS